MTLDLTRLSNEELANELEHAFGGYDVADMPEMAYLLEVVRRLRPQPRRATWGQMSVNLFLLGALLFFWFSTLFWWHSNSWFINLIFGLTAALGVFNIYNNVKSK